MTEELPRLRSDYAQFRHITSRWMDNDQYGHVNNVVYYSYFDTAVNGYLIDACGMDVRRLAQIGVVAETSCRFLSQLSFPDLIVAGLRLEKLGRSSVIYRIGLFCNDEVQASAVGRFVHVYVDAQSRKSVEVPAVIRRALEALRVG